MEYLFSLAADLDEFEANALAVSRYAPAFPLPPAEHEPPDDFDRDPYAAVLWDPWYATVAKGDAGIDGAGLAALIALAERLRDRANKEWKNMKRCASLPEGFADWWHQDVLYNHLESYDAAVAWHERIRQDAEDRYDHVVSRRLALLQFLQLVDDGVLRTWGEVRAIAPSPYTKSTYDPPVLTPTQRVYLREAVAVCVEQKHTLAWDKRGTDLFNHVCDRLEIADMQTPRRALIGAGLWRKGTPLVRLWPDLLRAAMHYKLTEVTSTRAVSSHGVSGDGQSAGMPMISAASAD